MVDGGLAKLPHHPGGAGTGWRGGPDAPADARSPLASRACQLPLADKVTMQWPVSGMAALRLPHPARRRFRGRRPSWSLSAPTRTASSWSTSRRAPAAAWNGTNRCRCVRSSDRLRRCQPAGSRRSGAGAADHRAARQALIAAWLAVACTAGGVATSIPASTSAACIRAGSFDHRIVIGPVPGQRCRCSAGAGIGAPASLAPGGRGNGLLAIRPGLWRSTAR